MTEALVDLDDVHVWFPIVSGVVLDKHIGDTRAVDGVSLTIRRGETLGLVGESGSGKTTLGRAILRLYDITSGTVTFDGIDITRLGERPLRRLRRRMQMVFQDTYSAMNGRHNVSRIIGEPLRVHRVGGGRSAAQAKVSDLLRRVGLPDDVGQRYPHEFSGGQRQRIGVARALALSPELVVLDEPVSALDVSIQAQILNLLSDLQRELSLTYLFISHDLGVVRWIADRVAVMYLGVVVEIADADTLFDTPLHPYSRALLSAIPIPDPAVERARERIVLAGDQPSPSAIPSGCRFHTRCPFVQETRCRDEQPALRELGGSTVACHWAKEIASGEISPTERVMTAPS